MLFKHANYFSTNNKESPIQNHPQVYRHTILINFHMMKSTIIVK